MLALIIILVFATTLWAAFDAGVHEGSLTGIVVFIACAVLWIVAFPLYLAMRSKREREAR